MSALLGILNFFTTTAFWIFLLIGVSESTLLTNDAVFFTIVGCALVLNTFYAIKNILEE